MIVRSASTASALARSLATAGVPVDGSAGGGPVGAQPAARALLTVLSATIDGLGEDRAITLLTGPIGRVDPVSLRQLRRVLRRTGTTLPEALTGQAPQLPGALGRAVKRVRSVLAAAARANREHRDPRYTLAGVGPHWFAAPLVDRRRARWGGRGFGGPQSQRGHCAVRHRRDLRRPHHRRVGVGAARPCRGSAVAAGAHRLRSGRRDGRGAQPARCPGPRVGHGHHRRCAGGLWPNTTPRGGVLGTQRLLDVLDGLGEDVSTRAPLLAEERRLLIAAMGRARRRLLITAVDSDAGDEAMLPSVFVTGWQPWQSNPPTSLLGRCRRPHCCRQRRWSAGCERWCVPLRALSMTPERSALQDNWRDLPKPGVPGADPAQWQGLAPLSTEEPVVRPWTLRHADSLDVADVDRLPVALAGRGPWRHRPSSAELDPRIGGPCVDRRPRGERVAAGCGA